MALEIRRHQSGTVSRMLVRTVPDQHKREATNSLVSDTILTLCFLFLPFRDLGKTTTSTATTSIQQLSLSTRLTHLAIPVRPTPKRKHAASSSFAHRPSGRQRLPACLDIICTAGATTASFPTARAAHASGPLLCPEPPCDCALATWNAALGRAFHPSAPFCPRRYGAAHGRASPASRTAVSDAHA